MASERLKTYLDAKKHENVLLGRIDQYLQLQPNDRDPTVIHPSEMSDSKWCPRATWHRMQGHKMKTVAPVTLRAMAIFDEGHSIHEKWQRWLSNMGILYGRWVCSICMVEAFGWSDEILGSTGCSFRVDRGSHLWEYKEVPLQDSKRNIHGHADGVVNPTDNESLLVEVKSIGPGTLRMLDLMSDDDPDHLSASQFSKISRPTGGHFRQVQIYMRLLNSDGFYVSEVGRVERAVVIYEHKADQQFREFVVAYDAKWTDDLFGLAEDIMWAVSNDRNIACPYGGCAKCRAYEEDK